MPVVGVRPAIINSDLMQNTILWPDILPKPCLRRYQENDIEILSTRTTWNFSASEESFFFDMVRDIKYSRILIKLFHGPFKSRPVSSARLVNQEKTGHEKNHQSTWRAYMRWTDVRFAHAIGSASDSKRHVGIPTNGFKDWIQCALLVYLCSGRLIVDWVDFKQDIDSWVFQPKEQKTYFFFTNMVLMQTIIQLQTLIWKGLFNAGDLIACNTVSCRHLF